MQTLDGVIRDGLGDAYNEAVTDLAHAMLATASADNDRLQRLGGLGQAALRAALTYRLERSVPLDVGCDHASRFDAVYEGLGISVTFAPMIFPEKRQSVGASCVATALATARMVDGAVLGAITTEDERDAIRRVVAVLTDLHERASRLAATAASLSERARGVAAETTNMTVGQLAQLLNDLRTKPFEDGHGAGSPSADEEGALASLQVLQHVDPAPFAALAAAGLADVKLVDLFRVLQQPHVDVDVVVRLVTSRFVPADMRDLLRSVSARLESSVGATLVSDATAVLSEAVRVENGMPTIDPNVLVDYFSRKFGRSSPWIAELNGGLPKVDFANAEVVADVSLGYSTRRLGVVGRGWVNTYDIDNSQFHSDYTHAGGSLEGWWLANDSNDLFGGELRLAGEFDYYDTTSYPKASALSDFYDFDSRMIRGNGLLGVRYGRPSDRFTVNLLVGGGVQYEDPDTTQFTGAQNLDFNSQSNWTVEGTERLLVRVRVFPGIFGVRLRSEGNYFSITRDQVTAMTTGAGVLSVGPATSARQSQLEIHNRLFFDLDLASFEHFVPAVFLGLDYLDFEGSATTSSAVIPSLGLGIVRRDEP